MYGQNAIAVNEFLGKSWSHVRDFIIKGFMKETYGQTNTNTIYFDRFLLAQQNQ